ncbi:MAG TPA: hypothetical protein VK308_14815 [Pyrinomonadaceae bacterium]|nr:hypothetical protein [Pyrinomonadaceae bacterium]
MKTIFSIFFILMLAFVAFGQEDLPIIGKVSDLSEKTKVYLIAPTTKSRERIQKILDKDKSFQIVSDPKEADFMLEFKPIAKTRYPIEDSAEMTAYFYNAEKRKVLAWSKTYDRFKKVIGKLEENEDALTKQFLKAIKDKNKQ